MNDVSKKVDETITLYHWSRWLLALLVAVAIILVATVQFITLSSVQQTTDQIQSCIDPHGACYKSGDRRSGAAVKTISDNQKTIVVAAAFCAKQPGNITLAQIEDCVNKELQKK